MEKLRDQDVRDALLEKLSVMHQNEDTRIINELAVCGGLSRVDVAVVNGILHGYEIKSESDTLYRLPNQMSDYNKVFERVTIVAANDYITKIKSIVPEWWGIITVLNNKGNVSLKYIKKGRKNPSLDSLSLVQLLWRDEALEILKEKGLQKGYLSKPKRQIYERIVDSIPLEELKQIVNYTLKIRKGWRDH
nr:sce7726 family protein [Brevibacillus laterosporus]